MRCFAFTKTSLLSLLLVTELGCSSGENGSPAGTAGASNAGSGGTGAGGGAAGSSAGANTAGSGVAGGASGGTSSGGTTGVAGSSVSAGTTGVAGSGGSGGAAPTTPTPVCDTTGKWQSAEPFGKNTYDIYFIRNNEWNQKAAGDGDQSLWASSSRCWGVDATHTDAEPKGAVKGYPDIARGWVVGTAGYTVPSHGLGIQVSALTKARIRWKMQAPTTGRTWALWDIYLHESQNPASGRAPVNLMIQQRIVDSDGWMQMDSSAWPKVTIDGITFREKLETTSGSSTRNRIQLYIDVNTDWVLGMDDMKLDLKAVIDHYVTQGSIRSTDYLTSIQAGWEIVSGGAYVTDEFWTAVQNEPDGP